MKIKLFQMRKAIVAAFILPIVLFVFDAFANASTVLYYTSAPSSVGYGETVMVTPLDGFLFDVSRNYDQGVSFWIDDLANNPDFSSRRWWYLDLAGPTGQPLQTGHYANATRFPFQDASDPGLEFGGNGRGTNTLTGYFDVLEVSYNGGGNVSTFAADFVQFDEGNQEWWTRGSVRYNSNVAVVPEPISSILFVAGGTLLAGCYIRRKKKA